MIVLDACVLIGFVSPSDANHQAAVRLLSTTEPLLITALTGAELMVRPSSRSDWHWSDLFHDLTIETIPITAADMSDIAKARRESRLKMPDALIIWAATRHKAAVASFDQQLLTQASRLGLKVVQ
ncbi:MAG: PIN domain-containing protein [Propionibacteriaceae bacterium]|jgi:predicted nucleic acid-binding protein|nr:PIN domain-containing protein [Propionibacteriaceae bacterium]